MHSIYQYGRHSFSYVNVAPPSTHTAGWGFKLSIFRRLIHYGSSSSTLCISFSWLLVRRLYCSQKYVLPIQCFYGTATDKYRSASEAVTMGRHPIAQPQLKMPVSADARGSILPSIQGIVPSWQRVSCSAALPATISAPRTSICPTDTLSLSAVWSGPTTGMTHQWQISADRGTTWVRMGSQDSTDAMLLAGTALLGGPVQVRLMTSCGAGASEVFSNVLTLTKGAVADCACRLQCGNPNPCAGNIISAFQSPNTNYSLGLTTNCLGNCLGFTRPADTLRLLAGTTVDVAYTNGSRVLDFALWLDFDRDSMLAPLEWINLGNGVPAAASRTVTISIPAYAANGVSTARLVSTYLPNSNTPRGFCAGNASFMGYSYTFPVKVSGGTTSLPSSQNNRVQAYPNPTTGRLHLEGLEEGKVTEVYVHDLMGKEVTTSIHLAARANEFNMGAVPGVYVLKVVQSGKVHVQRVVVQ